MEVAYRWQHIEDQFKAQMAVTPEDMMRVAKKYFTRDNCVTGVLERDGGGRAATAPNPEREK
jgi:predicted Zn-dependent peptidase